MSHRRRSSPNWRERADAVRSLPLEDVLRLCGAERDGRDKQRWDTDRGAISVNGAQFMNWREHAGGGGAIDLVMHLTGMSFQEAVQWLERQPLSCLPTADDLPRASVGAPSTSETHGQLQLPPSDPGKLAHVRDYLTTRRHLRGEIVQSLIQRGAFYADARRNAVFLMERGRHREPIGAELRGTAASGWRGLAPGSCKDDGYFWCGQQGVRRVILCESAIDAISCYQLLGACICISTAGARPRARWLPALLRRGYEVHNGFDNDDAGETAAAAMRQAYPTIHRMAPPAKDWNAALHRWA